MATNVCASHVAASQLSGCTADQPPPKTISIKSFVNPERDVTVEVSPVTLPTQCDRYMPEHKPRSKQSWNAYRDNALGNRPEEPLLFNPSSSPLFRSFDFHLDNVPRYLFRTFDWKSFGRSDEDLISSSATEIGTAYCKSDIFSLDRDLAMSIVDRHMNPWGVKDYENHPPDNFMSWTSSLLYAVQYALYRRHHFGCMSEEIKICVVDTAKFPRGQFIHAKCLLQAYYQVVKRIDMRHSISPRLLCYIYQNGEYLSQGLVNHRGRSCLLSLADLERSGLYSLYPELAIPEQHSKWAITTANLRKVWTAKHVRTSSSELEAAILLARSCFVDFDVLDMAIIVLSFKRRKLAQLRCARNQQDLQGLGKDLPEWGRKPQEVRQYLAALHILQPVSRTPRQSPEGTNSEIGSTMAERNRWLIQELLRCFPVH